MTGFWWFMLAMDLLIPAFLLVCGVLWGLTGRIPRFRSAVGYKTAQSFRSPAAWTFAHQFFGRIGGVVGLVMLFGSVTALLLCPETDQDTVGTWGTWISGVQCALLFVPIIATQVALRRRFGPLPKHRR
jgi:hypothetical protein